MAGCEISIILDAAMPVLGSCIIVDSERRLSSEIHRKVVQAVSTAAAVSPSWVRQQVSSGSAPQVKRPYTSPYHEFSKVQRQLLPANLCNANGRPDCAAAARPPWQLSTCPALE